MRLSRSFTDFILNPLGEETIIAFPKPASSLTDITSWTNGHFTFTSPG